METKHTKGEWLAEIDYPDSAPIADNKCHTIEIRAKGYEWICSVMPYGKKTKEQTEANAKLIASAPELLEALIKLYGAIDSCIDLTFELLKDCKNAIKKATE